MQLTRAPLGSVLLDRRQQVHLGLDPTLLDLLAQPRVCECLVGRHTLGRVDREAGVDEVTRDRRDALPILGRLR